MAAVKRPLKQSAGANSSAEFTPKSPCVKDDTLDYDKKTQVEHILLRPDAYIGAVEHQSENMWVWDEAAGKMARKDITFAPGLYKIFDEILVNAADNKQRDDSMNLLAVEIDQENGMISVLNNGKTVPVEKHTKHQVYVPELVFGELLTSSNFDDGKKKVTGGRNGFGAKLTNIYSTEFVVECNDSVRGRKFRQVYRNNMSERSSPEIKTSGVGKADWTKISFKPDLARFGMSYLDGQMVALMTKRVYDMAGCTGRSVKVSLNGKNLPIKTFKDYINLYISADSESPLMYERVNDRWEVAISVSDGTFQQVSFVNSICTSKGGKHLDYVADQLVTKFLDMFKKKHKNVPIKPTHIKNQLAIYMNCLVENPAFNSQTKEYMTTKASAFGSSCALSDKLIKQVLGCGVVDNILNWAKMKAGNELKRTDGKKKGRVSGIAKLDDANQVPTCPNQLNRRQAGGKNASQCSLILTEGDSAKALAVSGLGVVGRDHYGVFPLKGKLLNVRDAVHKQIMENAEINNIKQIMGLQHGKKYTDTKSLRYGHILIMADQDHDGSHIKGLVINMIATFWPSLLQIPGFLQEFVTPIVKVTKGSSSHSFFTQTEYAQWKEQHDDGKGWKIKYYKGLGTSTSAEAKEYFSNLELHQLDFSYTGDHNEQDLDMAFNKKKADARKEWLNGFDPESFVDHTQEAIDFSDFVHNELIHFSMADNLRSIPSMVDGLKPGQRKVLFACFKRKLKNEIKVAQLAGYVSEHAAYHHGEASLCGTIINMAQDFLGSNNINLLMPNGQFGTRLQGGKDAASPRYVFTQLSPITRVIFNELDDQVLRHLTDDGMSVEPEYYVPLIPMSLVNGASGIGTGWSSDVPCFNPHDIVANLKRLIGNEEMEPMVPWYRGFTGLVEPKEKDPSSFTTYGVIQALDDTTVEITELPLKKWTQDYKEWLEERIEGEGKKKDAFIQGFEEHHTDTKAHFVVTLSPENMAAAQAEGLHKKFKLTSSVASSNMHLFDFEGRIKKYSSCLEVLSDFYQLRLKVFGDRKDFMLKKLRKEWSKLDNRQRFIQMVVDEELVVAKKKKADLLVELANLGFEQFSKEKAEVVDEEQGEDDEDAPAEILPGGYDYLLGMPMWSLTLEKIMKLQEEASGKLEELNTLEGKTLTDLFEEDLDELDQALSEFEAAIEAQKNKQQKIKLKANAKKGKGKAKAAAKKKLMKVMDDSDELDDFDFDDGSDEDSDFEGKAAKKKPAAKAPRAKPAARPAAKKAAALPKEAEQASNEPLSLMERLAQRKQTEPAPSWSMMDDDEDFDDAPAKPAPAKKKPAPRVTKKKAVVIDSDEEDDDEDFDDEPAPAKKKLAPRVTKKKAVVIDSDEEDDDEDFDDEPAPAKKKLAPRVTKKKAVVIDSDEEDDDEWDFDDEPAPAKKPAPKKAAKRAAPVRPPKQPELPSESAMSPSISPPTKKRQVAKPKPAAKPAAAAPKARPGRAAASKAKFEFSESDTEAEYSVSDTQGDDEECSDEWGGSDSDF